MRVLVTGGSGFLGAWIIKRLVGRDIAVRVFDINADRRVVAEVAGSAASDIEWLTGDIRSGEDVSRAAAGCDGVIHLAGILGPACQTNPVRGAEINLIGSLNVFEAALKYGFRSIVYASSVSVYGPDDARQPLPVTHYGAFKLAIEGSARAYWNDHRIASVGLRPFVVYGPGREVGASAGPSIACRAAVRGEPYVIPFTGATGLIYVEDVAAAFTQALLTPVEGAREFNLVGEVATVDDVIAEIRRQVPGAKLDSTGSPLPIAPHLTDEGLSDFLPGLQRTSLAEGVAATIEYCRANLAARG